MAVEVFTNDTRTTLASTIAAGALIMPVTSNFGVPVITTASGNWFWVRVDDEYFKVTDTTSLNWLVAGAQQGTAPSTHFANKTVYLLITKSSFESLSQGGSNVIAWAARPLASSGSQNVYNFTDSRYTLFDTGSSLIYKFNDYLVTPPPSTGWAWSNQGGATITNVGGEEVLTTPVGSGARYRIRPIPATPYTITALFQTDSPIASVSATGLGFYQSSSTRSVWEAYSKEAAGNNSQVYTIKFSAPGIFSAFYNQTQTLEMFNYIAKPLYWLQVTDNGTNLIFRYSSDGFKFTEFDSRSRLDYLTVTGPSDMGFFISNSSGTLNTSTRLISWVQT